MDPIYLPKKKKIAKKKLKQYFVADQIECCVGSVARSQSHDTDGFMANYIHLGWFYIH